MMTSAVSLLTYGQLTLLLNNGRHYKVYRLYNRIAMDHYQCIEMEVDNPSKQ